MHVLINIDDDLYTRLFDNDEDNVTDMRKACVAIRRGTLLPKGHGDLIDRKELLKQPMDTANYPSNYVRIASAIIEADKSEEDNKNE